MNLLFRNILLLIFCCSSFSSNSQNAAWLVKPIYDQISEFREGVAAVRLNGLWGYVNERGDELLKPDFESVFEFSEGVGVVTLKDKTLIAIVDLSGKIIKPKGNYKIDNRFAQYCDGLLLVYDGKKWGYLNRSGELSISCKYMSAQPFSENFAAVCLEYRWFYIGIDGKVVVTSNPKRETYWAMGFRDGKAVVIYNDRMGCINRLGDEVPVTLPKITPPTEAINYQQNTLICKEGQLIFDSKCQAIAFIDKNGIKKDLFGGPEEPSLKLDQAGSFTIKGQTIPFTDNRVYWNSPSLATIAMADGKFGVVSITDNPSLHIDIPIDTLRSILGNPVEMRVKVKNNNAIAAQKIEVVLEGSDIQRIEDISGNGEKEVVFKIAKNRDLPIEFKDLRFTISENELLVAKFSNRIAITERQVIRVNIANRNFDVKPNEKCKIPIEVINTSDIDALGLKIGMKATDSTISTDTIVNIKPTDKILLAYITTANVSCTKQLEISIKPPNSAEMKIIEAGIKINVVNVQGSKNDKGDIINTGTKVITK